MFNLILAFRMYFVHINTGFHLSVFYKLNLFTKKIMLLSYTIKIFYNCNLKRIYVAIILQV